MEISEKTAVALGYFDSMHIGHMAVINKAVSCGYAPAVFSFYSESGKRGEKPLLSPSEKVELFEKSAVKYLFMPDFKDIKELSGKDFFEKVLIEKMKAAAVVCGEDYRFGKNAECSVSDLKVFCSEYKAELYVVPLIKKNGNKVSTTEIRKLLSEKAFDSVAALLGRKNI